jgi:glycosyltransferase involved in cell wall biosynthesis
MDGATWSERGEAGGSMALVSILIPCYNAGPWISGTIESALAQDWPEKEVIVVDDGSADDSLRMAQSFAPRGVRVISQPNRGAAAARNAAFAESRGEWIQFLDADDLLAPDKISHQMRLAADAGPEAVLTARWARFENSPADASFCPLALCVDAEPVEWVIRKLNGHDMMHPAAWLVPRSLAHHAGPWDERLSLDDDGEYFTRVVLASGAVRHCPPAVSYYRSNMQNSLSRQRSERACRSALLSIRLCAQHLLAVEDSPRTRKACANMFMRLCQTIYPMFPDIVAESETQAHRYGGSTDLPLGGPAFRIAARLLGWKAARRIQLWRRGGLANQ